MRASQDFTPLTLSTQAQAASKTAGLEAHVTSWVSGMESGGQSACGQGVGPRVQSLLETDLLSKQVLAEDATTANAGFCTGRRRILHRLGGARVYV